MAKYLIRANYSSEGSKGLLKEGGTKRKAAIEKAIKSSGAKLDAMYYALGDDDLFLVVDAPDNATIAALSIAVASGAAIKLRTTPLLTVAEIDAAVKKNVSY